MGFPYYTMDISEVKEDINTYKTFFKKHKLKLYETRFS